MNTTIGTTKLQSGRPGLLKLVVASVALALLITGCVRPGTPQGWSGVAIEGDQLYVGTQDQDVRALNAETGQTIWEFNLRGEVEADRAVYGTPAISDGVAYVGGYDGMLYALNLANGNDLWDATVGNGEAIVGGAAVGGGLVFVGSSDGFLYAYDAEDGVFQWRFPTGNFIWATPAVANDRVYFGSMDQKVYALDLDGQLIWEFPTGGAVTAEPLVRRRTGVHRLVQQRLLRARRRDTASMIWKFPDANNWYWSRAVTNGDTLFVGSTDGNLYALDAGTGRLALGVPY